MWSLPRNHLKSKLVRAEKRDPFFFTCPLPCSHLLGQFPLSPAPSPSRAEGKVLPAVSIWLPSQVLGCIMTVHSMNYRTCLSPASPPSGRSKYVCTTSILFPLYTGIICLCTVKQALRMLRRGGWQFLALLPFCADARKHEKGSHVLTTGSAHNGRKEQKQLCARHGTVLGKPVHLVI